MPSLASGSCDHVGPTSCAAGFAISESGWGCRAVINDTSCAGATRAKLGETSCMPIDDGSAAFPPSGAIVVDDDASLTAALATAKRGRTIALEAGTYHGFEVPRDLHIVGRSTEKVVVKGSGEHGIYVGGEKKVSIASLTIEGFEAGVVASWGANVEASKLLVQNAMLGVISGGAQLHVTGSVIETAATDGSAMSAQAAGSLLFEDGEIRGYTTVASSYEKGTELAFRRSIARYEGTRAAANLFMTFGDAHTLVDESAVLLRVGTLGLTGRDLPGVEKLAGARGGHLELKNSYVKQSGAELTRTLSKIIEGAHVTLDGTTLEHQSPSAIMAGNAGSRVTAKDSVIRGVATSDSVRNAIWALHGGSAELEGSAIVDAQGDALVVANEGSRMTLTRSLVHGTRAARSMTDPQFGAAGIALLAGQGGTASIESSAIVESNNLGVLVGQDAQATLARSIVDATRIGPEMTGGSAIASVTARITVDQSLIRNSQDAAIVFTGGDGIVKHTRFVGNPVGVHLGEARIVDAPMDPSTAAAGELVFFANVFEGTEVMIREAPMSPEPLGE